MTEQMLRYPNGLAREAAFERAMAEVIIPENEARRTDLTVPGFDGKPLFLSLFRAENARGTAVILHGFTSCGEKFAELVHALNTAGWNAAVPEQRGHGRSWRDPALRGDTTLIHVDRFGDYLRDFDCVMDRVRAELPGPYVLYAHSMGGAVAALWLERHAGVFARAVLSSPMIAPALPMPRFAVQALCGAAALFGQAKKCIFAAQPWPAAGEKFESSCATSEPRFIWYDRLRIARPELRGYNPTYGWTRAACGVTKDILAPGAPERIDIPVRLYQAELDGTVLPGPQNAFIARVKRGELVRVKGAKHEIYRSADDVLVPWWDGAAAFLAEAAPLT